MSVTLEVGTLLHKRYEIVKILGQGDFGIVYQARDTRAVNSDRNVAIKQMPMQMIVNVDFGLARVFPPGFFQGGQAEFKHYRKGLAIGTAGYSPPEQYQGIVKPQSDIYALGATLHHLLTKRDPRKERPFTFQEHPLRSINSAVSAGLEAIVSRCVNRDVKERFPTAKEMQMALEGLRA